uniref:EF-hand domain-containing protein n=1 Tax=Pyrodinium bahamense TaxID=73915 RepID=A0A7S0AJQ7_9DINO
MTTVGYGDQVPRSSAGYVIVSLLMIVSALYMAMPIGIVGSAFNRVWEDRDRLLLLQRFREHLGQKGYTAKDIPELFLFFDEDKDGGLSLKEFTQMMSSVQLGIHEDRLVKLFHVFDRNGNGSVDDAELVRVLFPKTFCEIYGPLQRARKERRHSVQGFPVRRQEVTEINAFRPSVVLSPAPCAVGDDALSEPSSFPSENVHYENPLDNPHERAVSL